MNAAFKTDLQSEQNIPPAGFISKPDGIYREVIDSNDNVAEVWLCSPLQVDAIVRDISGCGWSRRVIVTDPDGTNHTCVIANAVLANSRSTVLKQLAHIGLDLASDNAAREALIRLLQAWKPAVTLTSTNKLGWTDDRCVAFVQGNGVVIGEQKTIFLNSGAETVATHLKSGGTLADWKTGVSMKCVGNPLMMDGVALALSGPLLQLLGEEGGGLHIRGKSSQGKSTILRAAVSVWGHPDFLQTWRATANGLEGIAAGCNGSLLALDELALIPPRDASDAAYMLADGKGKSRADASGRALPVLSWRLPILSSGEISLAAKIAEGGKTVMAGQNVRLLDIIADGRRFGAFDELHDAADGESFSKHMKSATAKSYGVAGPQFVKVLLGSNRANLIKLCREIINNFRSAAVNQHELAIDGESARAIARFAIIALAGELATAAKLTGWERDAAFDAALVLLGEWLATREEEKEVDNVLATVVTTQNFLLTNGHRFAQPGDIKLPNIAGYQDDNFFYVSPDAWQEMHHGHSPEKAGRSLKAEGFLQNGDGNSLSRRLLRSTDLARPRYYWIRKSIITSGVNLVEPSDQSDRPDSAENLASIVPI